MEVIGSQSAECRNCYRCVRSCALKAISIQNSIARIMDERCILCGRCLEVCPQNAKTLISDLDRVKQFLREGKRVIVSLAPSHASYFLSHTPGQTVQALLLLGFSAVFETAEGAGLVTGEYRKLLQEGRRKYIISSCCPSINDLIEIYYPALSSYLAPVVSPMIAHGKLLRRRCREDTDVRIVFIGPCIAKKREAEADPRTVGVIDAVLSFSELERWLAEEGICPASLKEAVFSGNSSEVYRDYPEEGGILSSLSQDSAAAGYQFLSVSGLEACMDLFSELQNSRSPEPCFFEVNACSGGCVNGSTPRPDRTKRFSGMLALRRFAQDALSAPAEHTSFPDGEALPSLERTFQDRSSHSNPPSEEDIRKVLNLLGKHSEKDMLNCGACGYNSCREKAAAVLDGKAELTMCLPYMQEKAQSMANMVLDHTPNILFILDRHGILLEYSQSAELFFAPAGTVFRGMDLGTLIDTAPFLRSLESKEAVYDRNESYPNLGQVTLQKIIPMEAQNCVLVILEDITQEDIKQKAQKKLRQDTVEMAQKVIDRQMFVAQEIAGLLGETTAETKITLNRLRDMIEQQDSAGTDKVI